MAIRSSVYVDVIAKTDAANKNLLKFAAGAGVAALAIKKIIDVGKELVASYKVQEQAEAKLAAVLKATGNAVGISHSEMLKMASSLQDVTTYGDEAIIAAQGLLTTFTQIGTEVFPTALQATLDMAEMFGGDLKQASIQLGTALNDPIAGIGRLKRIGVSFTEDQKKSIKTFMDQNDIMSAQGVILDELKNEFGGVAKAAGDTATGSMEQYKNAMSDLKEVHGEAIAEGMQPFVKGVTEIIKELVKAKREILDFADAIEDLKEGGAEELPANKQLTIYRRSITELAKQLEVIRSNPRISFLEEGAIAALKIAEFRYNELYYSIIKTKLATKESAKEEAAAGFEAYVEGIVK